MRDDILQGGSGAPSPPQSCQFSRNHWVMDKKMKGLVVVHNAVQSVEQGKQKKRKPKNITGRRSSFSYVHLPQLKIFLRIKKVKEFHKFWQTNNNHEEKTVQRPAEWELYVVQERRIHNVRIILLTRPSSESVTFTMTKTAPSTFSTSRHTHKVSCSWCRNFILKIPRAKRV